MRVNQGGVRREPPATGRRCNRKEASFASLPSYKDFFFPWSAKAGLFRNPITKSYDHQLRPYQPHRVQRKKQEATD